MPQQNSSADAMPVIVEQTFAVPVGNVWGAITDHHQMQHWYFDLPEFRPEVGFEFRFTGGTPEHQYLHLCKIEEVIPLKKLKHSWRYDGYEGMSHVTFELFDEGEMTRVKLTHEGLETLPQSNPDFAKSNFAAGWKSIIGSSLEGYLDEAAH